MQTHDTEVVRLILLCVTMKTSLAGEEGNRNHLIKSASIEKLSALSLISGVCIHINTNFNVISTAALVH